MEQSAKKKTEDSASAESTKEPTAVPMDQQPSELAEAVSHKKEKHTPKPIAVKEQSQAEDEDEDDGPEELSLTTSKATALQAFGQEETAAQL